MEDIESQLAQLKVCLLPSVRVSSRKMFWRGIEFCSGKRFVTLGGVAHCTMLISEHQEYVDEVST